MGSGPLEFILAWTVFWWSGRIEVVELCLTWFDLIGHTLTIFTPWFGTAALELAGIIYVAYSNSRPLPSSFRRKKNFSRPGIKDSMLNMMGCMNGNGGKWIWHSTYQKPSWFSPQSSPTVPTEKRSNSVSRLGQFAIFLWGSLVQCESVLRHDYVDAENTSADFPTVETVTESLNRVGERLVRFALLGARGGGKKGHWG